MKKKEEKILVAIKEPGREPYVEHIDNTLEEMQEIVGGYIETFGFAQDACIVCNEEGKLMGLPYNVRLLGQDFVVPVFVCGVDGDRFTSIRAAHVPLVLRMLKGDKT